MPVRPECDGKTKHRTKLSAEYYLENKSSNASDSIYKCKLCKTWHIGHRGEKVKRNRKENFEKRRPPKIKKFRNRKTRE